MSGCRLLNHVYIRTLRRIIEATDLVIFPGVGVFDLLKWTYDGAFEHLFNLGKGCLKNFPKMGKMEIE